MKIAIAQFKPLAGDIEYNVNRHLKLIELALKEDSKIIFFSELSITGYEPDLINESIGSFDIKSKLEAFQKVSDDNDIAIGVGAPLKTEAGIQICMHWFQKGKPMLTYAKQTLHKDEYSYFVPGKKKLIFEVEGYKIAPAICYESLLSEHAHEASKANSDIYLASVAKSSNGIENAKSHYARMARQYGFFVLFSNSIGYCDNYISVGSSSAWNPNGKQLAQLDQDSEGVLMVNIESDETCVRLLDNGSE